MNCCGWPRGRPADLLLQLANHHLLLLESLASLGRLLRGLLGHRLELADVQVALDQLAQLHALGSAAFAADLEPPRECAPPSAPPPLLADGFGYVALP